MTLTFEGHVTIELIVPRVISIGTNTVSKRYWDVKVQMYQRYHHDLSRLCDVIGDMSISPRT